MSKKIVGYTIKKINGEHKEEYRTASGWTKNRTSAKVYNTPRSVRSGMAAILRSTEYQTDFYREWLKKGYSYFRFPDPNKYKIVKQEDEVISEPVIADFSITKAE